MDSALPSPVSAQPKNPQAELILVADPLCSDFGRLLFVCGCGRAAARSGPRRRLVGSSTAIPASTLNNPSAQSYSISHEEVLFLFPDGRPRPVCWWSTRTATCFMDATARQQYSPVHHPLKSECMVAFTSPAPVRWTRPSQWSPVGCGAN
jgi:hypothetical protein